MKHQLEMGTTNHVGGHGPVIPMPPVPTTPMDMLTRAVDSGASIEVLEKLMALQERWQGSVDRREFEAAVAAAKAKIPPIARTGVGHNAKKYATFATIAKVVDPVLAEHGLSYRFRTTQVEGRINVTCVLAHRSGHCEESTLSGPADASGNKNNIQAIGSTLTYLQRYSLVQALGLAAADDDDGKAGGADGGVINDEQYANLTTLVTNTKSNLNLLLKWGGVESLADFPAAKYATAVAKLEAKVKS